MKLKSTSSWLAGWEGEATITTDHAASVYGHPVLVVDVEEIGSYEPFEAGYQIVEATEQELKDLKLAGYLIEKEANKGQRSIYIDENLVKRAMEQQRRGSFSALVTELLLNFIAEKGGPGAEDD